MQNLSTSHPERKTHVALYFALAFLWSWGLWSIPVLASHGAFRLAPSANLFFLFGGSAGPLIAVFFALYRDRGWVAMRDFAARSLRYRIGLGVALASLLLPPALGFIAALIHAHQSGTAFALALPLSQIPATFALLFLIGGSIQEEFGWAYAIDGLQRKFGLLPATLALGVIWGCWHLPLFFIHGLNQSYMPFWAFLILTISLRTMYVWAYESAGKSILVTLLFHTSANLAFNLYALVDMTPKNDQRGFIYFALLAIVPAAVMALTSRQFRTARGGRD